MIYVDLDSPDCDIEVVAECKCCGELITVNDDVVISNLDTFCSDKCAENEGEII